jgi:hypothetical protein
MTPRIPDLAGIVEVDDFRWDPETPQHDDMQQWCRLAPTEPFGRPHEREKREREVEGANTLGRRGELQGSWDCVVHPSPLGPPFI